MQADPMDLRVRVMADVDQGLGTKATAEKYRVSPDWVRKLKRFRRQTGSFAARQQRVSHATKLDHELAAFAAVGAGATGRHAQRTAKPWACRWCSARCGGASSGCRSPSKKSDPCGGAAATGRAGPMRRLGRGTAGLGLAAPGFY